MIPATREKTSSYLQQALGHEQAEFRPGQWEAIDALVNRSARLLLVQRTGWGKSIVYFLATRLLRDRGFGPTLLVSPLISLMRNQVTIATRIGIRAEAIHSGNTDRWEEITESVKRQMVDVLMISPERLGNHDFRSNVLAEMSDRIGLLVIDEAHCISDWGHDFRPDYKRITRILQQLPANVPVVATTATANERVVADVVEQLGSRLEVVRGPLARKSLQLQTIEIPNPAARMAWLAEHLPTLRGSGIVYTLTVRDAANVADWLKVNGIRAEAYTGDMDGTLRVALEDQLLNNELKALVATTALGMGFDKPDLGFVVHFQRPGSVVHYYQQIGRAGRELDSAVVVLLSGSEDREIVDYFIQSAFPPEGFAEEIIDALATSGDGLTVSEIERRSNLRRTQIEKTLRQLENASPAPVIRIKGRWYSTPIQYQADQEKIARITLLRKTEQARMDAYVSDQSCLMEFLQNELGDAQSGPCGRCEVCLGSPIVSEEYSKELAIRAVQYLRRKPQVIRPRERWPASAFPVYGWSGVIDGKLRPESGRALSTWGDAGWGNRIRRGKQENEHFDDVLVQAVVRLLREDWNPRIVPKWVTCVPSLRHPGLVASLAERIAQDLGLPFHACIRKKLNNQPQKSMQNGYRQAHNLDGAFEVFPFVGMAGPVLLVDDIVDSRWTFTVVSALLREAGCGPVLPVALAVSAERT